MPLYEYQCSVCERVFEAMNRMERADDPIFCPTCGCTGERIYSHFNIKVHPSYAEAQEIVAEKHRRGEIV